jgi:hypothetical protein
MRNNASRLRCENFTVAQSGNDFQSDFIDLIYVTRVKYAVSV